MCGIIGGTEHGWNYEAALDILHHRGPDGSCLKRFTGLTLGFVRLAIIDLSLQGMQPLSTPDGRYTIVYNGEIYGWHRLRQHLEQKGYVFRSHTDSEVFLYGWVEWKEKLLDRIDGMFAFAIYDHKQQEVHLGRDYLGIKPLYYFVSNNKFAFASELKGLISMCNDVVWQVDGSAVYDYLLYQYIPDPKSLYKGVCKLEPATILTYDLREKKIKSKKKYWELQVNTVQGFSSDNSQQISKEIREIIKQSVHQQLIADVHVGTYLSGGIDSSIVTAEAAQAQNGVDAFCIGFADKNFDETPYAKSVAKHVGARLHLDKADGCTTRNIYARLAEWFDEPFGDSTAYVNYQVANNIVQHAQVALSGDGGDEVFGGYERYRWFADSSGVHKANLLARQIYRKSGWDEYLPRDSRLRYLDEVGEYALLSGFTYEPRVLLHIEEVRQRLGVPRDYDPLWHFREAYRPDLPRMTMAQLIDLHSYLPSGMLTKVDRTSMAVSLEVRVPFLAKSVVEYAFGLPESVRCSSDNLKKILKKAYDGILPYEILYRRKQGFSVPEDYFLKMGLRFKERVLRDLWNIQLYG